MRLHEGDEVTIQPVDSDPVILHMQRYARVSRTVDGGLMVRLADAWPPGEEFGPIPPSRLLPGWRDERGDWRRW